MGQAVIRGADAYRRNTGERGRELFERVDRMAEGIDVPPNRLGDMLRRHAQAEREHLGETPALDLLEGLAAEIATHQRVAPSSLRSLRSTFRSRLVDAGVAPDNADSIVDDLVKAASADLTSAFRAAGRKDALRAFRQADRYWAERLDTIREVLQPILGRRSERTGAEVARAIISNAREDGTRLARLVRALPEEEARTVQAAIIHGLGRATSRSGNSGDPVFSLREFAANWDGIREAGTLIFDPDTLRSLDALARVARRSPLTERLQNPRKTDLVLGAAQVGHFFKEPITATLSIAAQHGAGRMFASPAFGRWLARMPRDPRRARSHVERLSALASVDPMIAYELIGLQDSLLRGLDRLTQPRDGQEPKPQPRP